MKLIDFVGLGESGELGPIGRWLGDFLEQVLVLPIEVEDLHELGMGSVDEFLAVAERRELLGLKLLEGGERLVEHGKHLLLAGEDILAGEGLVLLQPGIFLDQELVHFAA